MANYTFTADIERFVKKTKISYVTFIKKLAFQGLRGVITKTPVDTGRARANWRVNIDGPDLSVDWKEGPGGQTGDFVTAPGVRANINKFTFDSTSIWITNNIDYINLLENGYSGKAPNGMMAITFQEMVAGVDRLLASV